MLRAYSTINLKAVDDEQRIVEGLASTPDLDRQGDILETEGAKFTLPLPFLWQHRHDQPIGRVLEATITKAGLKIRAQIEKAGVLPEIDRAWTLIKAGLVRGLSIGWKPLEFSTIAATYGMHVKEWELFEVSAVTVPANATANIQRIKSIDAGYLAALGESSHPDLSGVSDASRVVKAITPKARDAMKNIREQISAFEATRQAKSARMTEIMQKAADAGTTLEEAEQQEYDGLKAEVKSIDDHLVRLADLEKINATKAIPVHNPDNPPAAAAARGGAPVITVTEPKLELGIGFARLAMAKAVSHLDRRYVLDVAKEMFPHDARLHKFIEQKGNVPAANTQNALWAGNLTYADNLASEFVEFLRPMTIIGKFGTNGVPSLRRVPFNIRFNAQTTGGEAWWVGQGAPKPVTSFEFTADTLTWAKVAAISVITQEQARFSTPSIEQLVRDGLAGAVRERLDRDFVDPAHTAVADVNPASITNGLTPLSSAGTSADNVRTDIQNLLEQFILDNVDVESLVLIMPNTLALALSLMVNSLGQAEFPGLTMRGGNLLGIPVITSQYAANLSGAGNMVIAVSANDVMLADDGQVNVDMSTEASLEMKSDPTNNSRTATATSLVSMWQTNSIALKAERFINWKKRRTGAVVYMDDVNWGAIGSPS